MQFILPYVKSRPQTGNLPSPSSGDGPVDETDAATQELDDQHLESQHEAEAPANVFEHSEYHTVENANDDRVRRSELAYHQTARKKFRPASATPSTSALENEADKCFIDYIKTQSRADADLTFLQSLLPDVKKMNCSRKRKFKTSVLQMIDNILDEQEREALGTPSTMTSWNTNDLQDLERPTTSSTVTSWVINSVDTGSTPSPPTAQYFASYENK